MKKIRLSDAAAASHSEYAVPDDIGGVPGPVGADGKPTRRPHPDQIHQPGQIINFMGQVSPVKPVLLAGQEVEVSDDYAEQIKQWMGWRIVVSDA